MFGQELDEWLEADRLAALGIEKDTADVLAMDDYDPDAPRLGLDPRIWGDDE